MLIMIMLSCNWIHYITCSFWGRPKTNFSPLKRGGGGSRGCQWTLRKNALKQWNYCKRFPFIERIESVISSISSSSFETVEQG